MPHLTPVPPDQLKAFLASALIDIKAIAFLQDIPLTQEDAEYMLRALGSAAMRNGIPDAFALEDAIYSLLEVMSNAKL